MHPDSEDIDGSLPSDSVYLQEVLEDLLLDHGLKSEKGLRDLGDMMMDEEIHLRTFSRFRKGYGRHVDFQPDSGVLDEDGNAPVFQGNHLSADI